MEHLALIMDGNRRWAREHKFQTAFHGYENAIGSIQDTIEFSLEQNIKYLSLFAMSSENFEKRASDEKKFLWNLMTRIFQTDSLKLIDQEICVKFIGDRQVFPQEVAAIIAKIEQETASFSRLYLNILFCYGGRQEIIAATQKLAEDVLQGKIKPEEITETHFRAATWCGNIPDPNILIRTGKRNRTSNFLTFQTTYTELFFPNCYWPELTKEMLQSYLEQYKTIQRNFGI